MILQNNLGPSKRPNTINNNQRAFYSFSVTPRKTNYIFKKIKQPQEIQISGLPSFRSVKEPSTSPPHDAKHKNLVSLKIQPSAEISCTSFMKSYIEKLKKQRKRQNKKQMLSKNHKQQTERANMRNKIYLGKDDIYMAKQMNQIFVLQKVKEKDRDNFMNTIGVISQNLLNHENNNLVGIPDIRHWKQPSWANKEKIDKLIKQIRESRKKIMNEQQQPQENGEKPKQQNSIQQPYGLPALTTRCRKRECRTTAKRTKKITEINFKSLQPWKQDANINQFSIQQYQSKDLI